MLVGSGGIYFLCLHFEFENCDAFRDLGKETLIDCQVNLKYKYENLLYG